MTEQNISYSNSKAEIIINKSICSNRYIKSRYEFFKRVFDILLSFIGLLIVCPIIIIFGILVKIESEGPVIYKQKRIGINEKVFTIYKIRSMSNDAEKDGAKWADKDDPRVTKIGRFIRKTRIDELPQIFNILKGDMSIVGPRPERPEFTYLFEKEIPGFINRVAIKPGLTGWAQVNGGYDITPALKYMLDMDYIRDRNFFMDIFIILKTVKIVFSGYGSR